MSIARVVTIFDTKFTDFTYNTYNFCWPVLEYGVAILVCCGPLLRPLFEHSRLFSFSSFMKKSQDSSGKDSLQKSSRTGFSQLDEGEIPLRPMAAATNVVSITGDAPRIDREMIPGNKRSMEKGLGLPPTESALPPEHIVVERHWDVRDSMV